MLVSYFLAKQKTTAEHKESYKQNKKSLNFYILLIAKNLCLANYHFL